MIMEENKPNSSKRKIDGAISGGLSKRAERMCKLIKYIYEIPFLTSTEIYNSTNLYKDTDIRTMEYDINNLINLEILKTIDGKICFFDYMPFEYELEKLYNLDKELFSEPNSFQRLKIGYADMFKRNIQSGIVIDKIMEMVIEFIGFEINPDTISRYKKFVKLKNKDCVFVEGKS